MYIDLAVNGYEDNTKRSESNITRDVVAMASRFDDLEVEENMFKDTKE